MNRWRVADNWWRMPTCRIFYKALTPAALIEVYVDPNTGDWFLECVVD